MRRCLHVLAMVAVAGLAGCRAHTQEIALDQAASDFYAWNPSVCEEPRKKGKKKVHTETGTETQVGDAPLPMESQVRASLTPWIVGPNAYVIEGCQVQARYTCDSERCSVDGAIVKQKAFVEVAAPPATTTENTTMASEAAPPAADSGAETDAVREALDARRGEIAACVDHLPVGLLVELKVGLTPAVSLRGALKGKPEEGCVRSALKDLKVPAVKAPFSVIHIVK